MFSVASWNIRGLNRTPKQKEVRQVVNENNLSVCAILESHVDVAVVYDTCKKVCKRWKWISNGSLCPKGTRIILGWDDDLNNLGGHASLMRDKPWVLLGDFNAALNLEDHSCGSYQPDIAMREFKECVQRIEVMDVNATGLHFTWNQKLKGSKGILKKIDRIMCNHSFLDDFPGSFAIFQPYRISNHSPCVLRIPKVSRPKPRPFKFSNFLIYKDDFRGVISNGWNLNVHGCAMYRVVKRLKGLKTPLRKLLHNQGNLHDRVNHLRVELDEAQKAIDRNPSCSLLRDEHAHYLLAFKEASLDEEQFLRQKSKIEWLNAGDANTAYFHRIVKSKCARNRIEMVRDSSNVLHEGNAVPSAFVSYYEQFLGLEGVTTPFDDQGLFTQVLSNHKAEFMVREVSDSEIKDALFSMGDDKAPDPDGFTAAFFKKSWDIVGGEITNAVMDFFFNGKLLKELNHTIISLIPKVSTPAKITDYRPMSCCNVLFKCISKIIANHIKKELRDLKAYDTVDWGFLRSILVGFGFHPTMVEWIMVYVSTTSYSVCINGDMYGWFNDDLFLFARGHPNFVRVIIDALEEFKNVLGLVLKQLMRGFLWCQGEMKKGKAKVAWEAVCLPHRKGGLGIRKLDDFNVALMAKTKGFFSSLHVAKEHRDSLRGHKLILEKQTVNQESCGKAYRPEYRHKAMRQHPLCTDKTKITRKPSKTVKHQAREWKSVQEPEAKVKKSKLSVNYGSTKVNHKKTKDSKVPNQSFKFQKITQMVLEVHLVREDTVANEESTKLMGFTLDSLTEQTQTSQSRIATLAIRYMRTRSQSRNRNRRQQQITPVIVEEPEIPMADNRTMAQMLQAPIEGYEDAIVVPLINANQFTDTLDSAAGGNFLDKMPSDGLAIIKSKSKNFQQSQLSWKIIEDKMNIRMSRLEKAISEKNATTPATVKAVEEVCVTCGSNHNFNNCPLTRN
ncbi:sodium/hydrogen exchanger 6 [Tanacetum coccineum]